MEFSVWRRSNVLLPLLLSVIKSAPIDTLAVKPKLFETGNIL